MQQIWPADKTERVSVKSLVPYANNARTHSDEQIAQIMSSIREWGFTTPILRDDSGMVIAGHGRLLAAMRLGLEDVPVMTATGWSESQKRAYVIADNRLALSAGWDDGLLSVEIGDLDEAGFDLELLGLDDGEIDDLLLSSNAEQLVEMPELPDGDREPFQNMTFTLHDDQATVVSAALKKACDSGPFDSENKNSNGNALARVCNEYTKS